MQMAQRWRRVSARMAQPGVRKSWQRGRSSWLAELVPTGTHLHGFLSGQPGTSAGESPLHQGRVSARLTGLRQRAASALELTQRSAGK